MRSFLFLFSFVISCSFVAQAQNNNTPAPSKKIVGDASLLTDYVWHGLTQTKKQPAIQSSLYYYLADTFRVGLWGSNVSYYQNGYGNTSKANALLKLQADIMLKFTPNFGMDLLFSDNHYFEPDDRDGNTFTVNFNTFGYNFGIEQEGNWQGTVTKARYYYLKKAWDVFGSWKWDNKVGYTQFETLNLKNYFDISTSIGTKFGGFLFAQLIFTGTNENTQFGDSADFFTTLAITATF